MNKVPIRGLAMLKRALCAAVNPNPTMIRGNCCDVLFGSSLKNMWKLRHSVSDDP